MRIEVIQEEIKFQALKEEWNALLSQSLTNEITLTWQWLYTWWQVFKDPTRKLLILTVRDDQGTLIGIAPLHVKTTRPYCFLPPIQQLLFLASGEEEADEVCSDYLNFILYPGQEEAILTSILDFLTVHLAQEWDEILLHNMRADAPASLQLQALLARRGIQCQQISHTPCSYITLPDNWDLFLQQSSSDLRSNIRRNRKALAQAGQISFMMAHDEATLQQGLQTLIDLHQRRWTEKGKPGVFLSEKFLAFHKRLLPLALNNQWLKLHVLSLDHTPIAAIYNFKYNNKIYFYQSGTNTHLKKKFLERSLLDLSCTASVLKKRSPKGRSNTTFSPEALYINGGGQKPLATSTHGESPRERCGYVLSTSSVSSSSL